MTPGQFKGLLKLTKQVSKKNTEPTENEGKSGCGCLIFFMILLVAVGFYIFHPTKTQNSYQDRCKDSRPGDYCE